MYAPKHWKHGISLKVGQVCEYLQENIPPDAMLCICGDSQVVMHLEKDGSVFSLDNESLADLPEYVGHEYEELCFEAE